ncbi:hypothetical protein RF11_12491 [Thelohanellus kitauei]|uniref:Uncharacterized protein n=1 Tax=Thelohanellus kitauei TaxID=669202 RepID=A0A0C2MR10_THEKT|nr:hypothetical protein RF11_12491 [Thelohanellus kitauei]
MANKPVTKNSDEAAEKNLNEHIDELECRVLDRVTSCFDFSSKIFQLKLREHQITIYIKAEINGTYKDESLGRRDVYQFKTDEMKFSRISISKNWISDEETETESPFTLISYHLIFDTIDESSNLIF